MYPTLLSPGTRHITNEHDVNDSGDDDAARHAHQVLNGALGMGSYCMKSLCGRDFRCRVYSGLANEDRVLILNG